MRFILISLLLVCFTLITSVYSQDDSTRFKLELQEALLIQNLAVKMPYMNHDKNVKGKGFDEKSLFTMPVLNMDHLNVTEGSSLNWHANKHTWQKSVLADSISADRISEYSFDLMIFYLKIDRWMEVKMEVSSKAMFEVYVDQKSSFKNTSFGSEKAKSKSKTLKLERGDYMIMVKGFVKANDSAYYSYDVSLETDKELENDLHVSLNPEKFMNIDVLVNTPSVTSVSISPNGNYYMIWLREPYGDAGKSNNVMEIRTVKDGTVLLRNASSAFSSIRWMPDGEHFSYVIRKGDLTDLIVRNVITNQTITRLRNITDMGSYYWAPSGDFVIYTVNESPEKEKTGLKRLEGMPDHWSWFRNRQFLYLADVKSGQVQRLTFGNQSTSLQDISPDSRKILFSTSVPDFSERPYSKQYMLEMTLADLSVDTLWYNQFGGSVVYAPDGKSLLVTGSPALFGDIGVNVESGQIPNDYDTQAYIYDLKDGKVEAISHDFDPSIQGVFWSKKDNNIYMRVEEKTYRKLYQYQVKKKRYVEIPVETDVLGRVSYANDELLAVYTGSSISTPNRAFLLNIKEKESTLIEDTGSWEYRNVDFGKTEEWYFKNKDGVTIDGRVYYPPDFDPEKKYPLIVYYYGGTSPTVRSFGGRYPKNLFAANGYVVYVLQPSGATGYGQAFSAAHVNNWGITVADEIIKGTKEFCATHSFINKDKIGCIGASYGGFMTMLLTTRTDIFAAAISHAGISSISSYWGEGYWGYLYSSVATANRFPWNDKQIYVDQSPLFNADKVTTPLLLLHGNEDTNVPPGESRQFYTALKLLGKTVELIEVDGQNHHIVDYKKRIEWQKTILAWYDKWLKDQDEWWNDMYPLREL